MAIVPELKTFVHRPYLVVTMADLWDGFSDSFDDGLVGPMLVTDLERLKKLKLTAVEAARYSLAVVLNARVAQWIERLPPEQEVAGSTPAAGIDPISRGLRATTSFHPLVETNFRYSVLVTFESERGLSGSRPLASASKAAKSCPGMM